MLGTSASWYTTEENALTFTSYRGTIATSFAPSSNEPVEWLCRSPEKQIKRLSTVPIGSDFWNLAPSRQMKFLYQLQPSEALQELLQAAEVDDI